MARAQSVIWNRQPDLLLTSINVGTSDVNLLKTYINLRSLQLFRGQLQAEKSHVKFRVSAQQQQKALICYNDSVLCGAVIIDTLSCCTSWYGCARATATATFAQWNIACDSSLPPPFSLSYLSDIRRLVARLLLGIKLVPLEHRNIFFSLVSYAVIWKTTTMAVQIQFEERTGKARQKNRSRRPKCQNINEEQEVQPSEPQESGCFDKSEAQWLSVSR